MKNQNLLDQFFLKDDFIVDQLISSARITKKDKVLEIGSGRGIITEKLVKKAGLVIAVEIDKSFAEDLKKIKGNLRLIFANGLDIFDDSLKYPYKFNKIVASLPSSIVEPLVLRLLRYKFEAASVLVPLKFVEKLQTDDLFTAYLDTVLVLKVAKTSFFPQPKTSWALVKITPKRNSLAEGDLKGYFKKYLFDHPDAKLKNSAMEAIIKIFKSQGKNITKNQARELISKLELPPETLENNFNKFGKNELRTIILKMISVF